MKASEATRVLNTARKHGEEVVELGIELINMLADSFEETKLEYEQRLDEANARAEAVQQQLDQAIDHAASVDCTIELAEARNEIEKLEAKNKELIEKYEKLSKKFEQEVLDSVDAKKPLPSPGRKAELLGKKIQTPEQPKPRRGRPPKNKDSVRSLAEELASMAPKD
jgi:predicted  nucleic acid-binding Zn-ribbon protein